MAALNGARKLAGVTRQGGMASPVVVNNTLRQIEREGQSEKLPMTMALCAHLLANKGIASEKMCAAAYDEVNTMRDEIRRRERPLTDQEVAAENASLYPDESDDSDSPRAG